MRRQPELSQLKQVCPHDHTAHLILFASATYTLLIRNNTRQHTAQESDREITSQVGDMFAVDGVAFLSSVHTRLTILAFDLWHAGSVRFKCAFRTQAAIRLDDMLCLKWQSLLYPMYIGPMVRTSMLYICAARIILLKSCEHPFYHFYLTAAHDVPVMVLQVCRVQP